MIAQSAPWESTLPTSVPMKLLIAFYAPLDDTGHQKVCELCSVRPDAGNALLECTWWKKERFPLLIASNALQGGTVMKKMHRQSHTVRHVRRGGRQQLLLHPRWTIASFAKKGGIMKSWHKRSAQYAPSDTFAQQKVVQTAPFAKLAHFKKAWAAKKTVRPVPADGLLQRLLKHRAMSVQKVSCRGILSKRAAKSVSPDASRKTQRVKRWTVLYARVDFLRVNRARISAMSAR